jgi:hypothetical protein
MLPERTHYRYKNMRMAQSGSAPRGRLGVGVSGYALRANPTYAG